VRLTDLLHARTYLAAKVDDAALIDNDDSGLHEEGASVSIGFWSCGEDSAGGLARRWEAS
jgi:hypothetical protein